MRIVKEPKQMKDLPITVRTLNTAETNSYVMQFGLEAHRSSRCYPPIEPIDSNCYFIDLTGVHNYNRNQWTLPLMLAWNFESENMRVFLERDGIIVASILNEDSFAVKCDEITRRIMSVYMCGSK